jgi:L-alanine-DL-glutamate epimerase-like enolase superfamily enzyme
LKIARIDLWHVAVPLPAVFRPAWIPGFRQTENRFDLIRLTTSDGIEGYSAAPAMGAERAGLGTLLGPYFLGERADDIASIRQRLREMSYLGWRVGWIEAACWDIVGKARNKPVYELLGGRGGIVKVYASTGEVKSAEERIEEVEARLAEGFSAVKLRVHDDTLEQDIAQIRETRKAVGGAVLGVDANMGWRVAVIADCAKWDWQRAYAFCQEATQLQYAWVEEPLPMDDYDGLARLCEAVDIPIAGGELNNQGLPEFKILLAEGCYDWIQPDAVMCGGVGETWAIMQHAVKAGRKYTPHTWTNGIGFAINLQIFAASTSRADTLLEYPIDPPGWMPEARDGVLREPWRHDRGALTLPTRPGLGFEIDPTALKRFGKRFFTATKLRVALNAIWDRGLSEARALGAVRDARLEVRTAEVEAMADPVMDALDALRPAT